MTTLSASFARDWLASKRDELNARFRMARRRSPSLDPGAVLELCAELLPALGGSGEAGAADLLSAMYDLILLHCGRGSIAPRGGSSPAIAALLRDSFPKLRPLLLSRPRSLPGALSNAVENLGAKGETFARRIVEVASCLDRGQDLPDAGAVLAWRLGEAQMRMEALRVAHRLPARAILAALLLPGWPTEAAAFALNALAWDGWRRPEDAIAPETIAILPKAPPRKLETILKELSSAPRAPLREWESAGWVGGFAGFDGQFEEPPLLVKGPEGSRHRFWVIASNGAFRIEADVYGWSCRPDAAAADYRIMEAKSRGAIASLLFGGDDGTPRLAPDGTVSFGGESARFAAAAGATSFAATTDFLAWTTADSHRIRIIVPRGKTTDG